MQKLMKAMHKNEKGFTLVELMVVVVIIGILVAIAIPVYNTVSNNANKRAVEANLRTIDGAIQTRQASEGELATQISDLVPAYIAVAPDGPTGASYDIVNGRAVASFNADTWGTHAAATNNTLQEVQGLTGW